MRRLKYIAALLAAATILLRPEPAVAGAQRAMRLWFSSVAPALFPFLVLMPVLTGPEACAAYRLLFSKIMHPLFHLPGEAAPAVIIGMISGSPGGTIAVSRIAGQSGMQRGQAWRIAMAVSGVSPAYLIMGVGQGLYGSAELGAKLAAVQMCVQLFMLFVFRGFFDEEKTVVPLGEAGVQENSVRNAAETVITVCGYMVFFSAVGSVVSQFLGKRAGTAVLAILDLPSGLAELTSQQFPMQNFVLGMAVGFAGLCIGMQNMDALGATGMKISVYIAARIISAVLTGCAYMRILPGCAVPTAAIMHYPAKTVSLSNLTALVLMLPVLIYFSKKHAVNKGRIGI